MGVATIVTFLIAAMLFAAIALVQDRLQLQDFRFGSKWSYSAETLERNIEKDRSKPPLVVVPVLFPLDFLLLIFLGMALALCSITYAEGLCVPPSRTWLLLVLPIAYMVADFSENVLYSGMLLFPGSIRQLIDAGNWATRLKLVLVALAVLQAASARILSWWH